jgi:hypothetical protein
MTLFYLDADGDIATEASRRQDQYRRGSPAGYRLPYHFLDDPSLGRPLPPDASLPDDFARHFRGSDLVRIRRGPVSATVLGGNSCVLSFHKGAAALEAMRLASAFFGKGQFVADRLEVEGDTCRLRQELSGPYWQPLPPEARHADGRWDPGDRARRQPSEVQRLVSEVVVRESAGAFEINLDVSGTDRVPLAIELGFRRGGALPKLDALSVYLTGFTPFRTTLRIG